MSQSVAEVVVDTLIEAGAKRCWGIVGDTINHLCDAIRRSDMRWVHVRHEEVGALAAGGEAYFTGELALCAGSAGPGSLHFVNGCERYLNRDSFWDQGRDVIAFPPISFRGRPRLGSSIQDTFVACC
tara:strand:- start:217 stop:597 length:381 start_codon:yes stop_codon:yes gene_type:complete